MKSALPTLVKKFLDVYSTYAIYLYNMILVYLTHDMIAI